MNTRVAIHVIAAVAAAVAGGTVKLAGLDSVWTENIAAIAAIVSLAASTYLATTTTGKSKTDLVP